MCANSRVLLACYVAVFAWALLAHSGLPILFLFVSRAYGTWLHELCALTQHTGLKENVLDYHVSSRTVLLNPVVRFLYWNMHYHIEHHIFPSVPFHALPGFHDAVASQMPKPYSGLWPAWREILGIFARQQRDPEYVVVRELPMGKRSDAVA